MYKFFFFHEHKQGKGIGSWVFPILDSYERKEIERVVNASIIIMKATHLITY